jgi:hypothetical protein
LLLIAYTHNDLRVVFGIYNDAHSVRNTNASEGHFFCAKPVTPNNLKTGRSPPRGGEGVITRDKSEIRLQIISSAQGLVAGLA